MKITEIIRTHKIKQLLITKNLSNNKPIGTPDLTFCINSLLKYLGNSKTNPRAEDRKAKEGAEFCPITLITSKGMK